MTPADATERQLAVEAERDALRVELAAVRRALQAHDNARRMMNAYEVARLDALPPEARQAAIDDASRAWRQALEEARHWNEAATDATERAERAEAALKVQLQTVAEFRAWESQHAQDIPRLKAVLLELLKALRPTGLRLDLPEWDMSVWSLVSLVTRHTQKALKDRDALRPLLRSIVEAWEKAPASRRHEVSTLLPSLAHALQAAREGRNAEWWTRE